MKKTNSKEPAHGFLANYLFLNHRIIGSALNCAVPSNILVLAKTQLHKNTSPGSAVSGVYPNLFDKDAKMVRFTPDVTNAAHTDASYHLPAFCKVWARVGPVQDREFWWAADPRQGVAAPKPYKLNAVAAPDSCPLAAYRPSWT